MKQSVVFTDLDGTLLDHATYSWEPALPALRLLHDRQIPLVCCSSKTRTEIEFYRRLLDNRDPFVTENGGGIFIPEGYFDLSTLPPNLVRIGEPGYVVIRLGAQYQHLRQAVEELRAEGFALTGFGDMTVAEVAELTGLPLDQAAMAKERDFDEPFVYSGSLAEMDTLEERLLSEGFFLTKGAFFHILADSERCRCNNACRAIRKKNTVRSSLSPSVIHSMICRCCNALTIQLPSRSLMEVTTRAWICLT